MVDNQIYEFRIRRIRRKHSELPVIRDPLSAANFFRVFCKEEPREVFMAAYLDTRNNAIGVEKIAIGNAAGVDVHPRELFRGAILAGATGIVVAHNHPSGHAEPSNEDIQLTRRVVVAGRILGIPILDHIIITEDSHYSIRAMQPGEMEPKEMRLEMNASTVSSERVQWLRRQRAATSIHAFVGDERGSQCGLVSRGARDEWLEPMRRPFTRCELCERKVAKKHSTAVNRSESCPTNEA